MWIIDIDEQKKIIVEVKKDKSNLIHDLAKLIIRKF